MFQIFIVLFNICTHLKGNTKFEHDTVDLFDDLDDPDGLDNLQTLTKQPMKLSADMNVS